MKTIQEMVQKATGATGTLLTCSLVGIKEIEAFAELVREEFSNGFALALNDAVLIRIGKDDESTRQATARIDKLVNKYKDEAAHGIKEQA